MRRLTVGASVIVLAAACSLIPSQQACPLALLEGRLADGGGHVETEAGIQPVRWPAGYLIAEAPNTALLDPQGRVVATEGETVYIGGGYTAGDELFIACGYVSRDPP